MTGYIQWHPEQEFKPQDVVLNEGFFWRMDDAGAWRIIDDSEFVPICAGVANLCSRRASSWPISANAKGEGDANLYQVPRLDDKRARRVRQLCLLPHVWCALE